MRAVFDTNIFVAATLSRNPHSPNQELLQRWTQGEFTLVTCQPLMEELAEKLLARHISAEKIERLLNQLIVLAEWVVVSPEAIEPLLSDPDDDVVLACAVVGHVHYLVTYDPHFDALGGEHQGIKIVKALPFLWVVRGDLPHTPVNP